MEDAGIGGVMLSAIEKGADMAYNYYSTKNFNRQQQANYQKNLRLSYAMNQAAQQNAASNAVRGYKSAGLSPALASAGNFSTPAASASMGASGSPNAGNSGLASAFVQGVEADTHKKQVPIQQQNADTQKSLVASEIKTQEFQQGLLREQANLAKAQADSIGIENARKDAEDNTFKSNLVAYAQRMYDDAVDKDDIVGQTMWQCILDDSEKQEFNVGTFKGMQELSDWVTGLSGNLAKAFEYEYNRVLFKRMLDLQAWDFVADMPRLERLQLMASIRNIGINATLMLSEARLNNQNVTYLQKQQEKIDADIQTARALAQKYFIEGQAVYHEDTAAMAKNGDVVGLGMHAFGEVWTTYDHFGSSALAGASSALIGSRATVANVGRQMVQQSEQFERTFQQKEAHYQQDFQQRQAEANQKRLGQISSTTDTMFDADGNITGSRTRRVNYRKK